MADAPRLAVTAEAERFMRRIVRFAGIPGGGFRVAAKAGGCSGVEASFSAEPSPQAGDAEIGVNGLRVFVAADSRALLDGATLDFAEAGGLAVHGVASACGCTPKAGAGAPAQATVSLDALRRR